MIFDELILAMARRVEERRAWKVTHTGTAPTYYELVQQRDDLEDLLRASTGGFNAAVAKIQDEVFEAVLRLPRSKNARNPFIRVREIVRLRDRLRKHDGKAARPDDDGPHD